MFHTIWNNPDILDPAVNQMIRSNGATGWFGWPADDTLETLRGEWFDATEDAERKRLAAEIQAQAYKTLPYIPLGNYTQPHAWSKKVVGVVSAPTPIYWNIAKEA